jgi:hypothetical protein
VGAPFGAPFLFRLRRPADRRGSRRCPAGITAGPGPRLEGRVANGAIIFGDLIGKLDVYLRIESVSSLPPI